MSYTLFGARILTASEQRETNGNLRFTVSVENPEKVKEIEKSFAKFDEYYKKLYKDLVGASHKYLIRVTPLHTGKLRGGWTAFLDKYQIDYSRQLYDTTLYDTWKRGNKTEGYRNYAPDSSQVAAGKGLSHLEDSLPSSTNISIENAVEYKDDMDFGTRFVPGRHFTDIALYKAEHWFDKHFSQWLAKMEKAGAIVPPPKVEEIPN